ncbi:hypothetical protein SAY86_019794 [Trapa natans]|uniref:Uncharacterized protein n=1 Tax=Trapa natans TaxID=22666 RepID=A0AAN7LMD5_TRANT|nr:hypothetical protein SAY86_019794 [Trapa natans]
MVNVVFRLYILLDRSWDKDEATLKSGFERLADFPMPFLVGSFRRGNPFYKSKAFSCPGVYSITRVAYSQECFGSSYQGWFILTEFLYHGHHSYYLLSPRNFRTIFNQQYLKVV